jgi:hypothetical protein
MINTTYKSFYRTPVGEVYSGDEPPTGSTLIVAPGGTIDDTFAEKLGVKVLLGGEPEEQKASDGEPLVTLPSGKAVALSAAPPEYREKREKETKPAEAPAATETRSEAKAVRPEQTENKGGLFTKHDRGGK